jgi:hypothetical protein
MPKLGRDIRREERLLSRTRVCVDRIGAFDDVTEGGFRRMLSPPSSDTTGVVHESRSGRPDSIDTC